MLSELPGQVPPPSPEAIQSIKEVLELLDQNDRKEAGRWLEGCFRAASPRLFAMNELEMMNDMLSYDASQGPKVYKGSRMQYDWLYYVSAAIKLNLDPFIESKEMLSIIREFRKRNLPVSEPPELAALYAGKKTSSIAKPHGSSLFERLGLAIKNQQTNDSDLTRQSNSLVNKAYALLQQGGNLEQAGKLAQQALDNFRELHNRRSEVDTLHILGRIKHEMDQFEQAMSLYQQELEIARSIQYQEAVARAMHECARIYLVRDNDLLKAEDGFRFAFTFYLHQKDEANMQAAINGFISLADYALGYEEFFIPVLEQSGVPCGTPEKYLYFRALAIRSEFMEDGGRYRKQLFTMAEREVEADPEFAGYILRDLKRIAEIFGDDEIHWAATNLLRKLP